LRSKPRTTISDNEIWLMLEKPYGAIVHFRPKAELSSGDTDRIDSQLAKLKAELRQLGEEL
jgi:hypothetical protein